jgi:hypothetical protein
MYRSFIFLLCCCAFATGCGKNDEPGASGEPPGNDSVPVLAERAQGATTDKSSGETVRQPCAVLDPCFELRASADEGPFTAGKPGNFAITIHPKNEYHLNLEFPTSVSMQAPEAISLDSAKLGKKDAAVFSEQLIRFTVPFTPAAAGAHPVKSEVAFAVCTSKVCIPKKETVTVELPVE